VLHAGCQYTESHGAVVVVVAVVIVVVAVVVPVVARLNNGKS
jgi:hypothetical protein